MEWVADELSDYREKLILLGTPAPYAKKNIEVTETPSKDDKQLVAINSFNKALVSECLKHGLIFADTLSMTADEHGFNNNRWMIDDTHMKPKAIEEIIAHRLIKP